MTRRTTTLLTVLFTLVLLSSDPRLQGISVDIVPLQQSIAAKGPLSLDLVVSLEGNATSTFRAMFVNYNDLKMRVVDSNGAILEESTTPRWRCEVEPRYIWYANFEASHEYVAREHLAFTEWCSTDLPEGKYRVECEISELGPIKVGVLASERRLFDPPLKISFPLSIVKRSDDAVKLQYEQLLADAGTPVPGATNVDGIARAVELLVYARDPLAVPSQIKLVSGAVEMWKTTYNSCNAIDVLLHLVDLNTPDVASGLCTAFEDLTMVKYPIRPVSRDFLKTLVLWGIHEMHKTGDKDIVRVTDAIVQSYPEPADPRTRPY